MKKNHFLQIALLATIALLMANFLHLVFVLKIKGAYMDMWDMLFLLPYLDQGSLTIGHFLEKHFAIHILLIPKLFYLLEYQVFSGRGYFLLVCSTLLFIASFGVIQYQIHTLQDFPEKKTCYFLVAVIFFTGWQIPNLLYTFQIQWYLSLLLTLFSALLLSRKNQTKNDIYLSVASAALASLCGFFGAVWLFVVIIYLFILYQDIRSRIVLFFMFIAAVFLFYPGEGIYRISGDDFITLSEENFTSKINEYNNHIFPNLFMVFFKILGNPWSMLSGPVGIAAGIMVFIFLMFCLVLYYHKNKQLDFWSLVTLYSLAAAFSIAIGRYKVGTGVEDRYVTIYALLSVSFFYWLLRSRWRKTAYSIITIFLISLMAVHYIKIKVESEDSIRRTKADINIMNGIDQNMSYHKIQFYAEIMGFHPVSYFRDYLSKKNLDVFYGLLKNIDPVDISNNACHAVVKKKFYLPQNNIRDYYLSIRDETRNTPVRDFYLVKDKTVYFYGTTYIKENIWIPAPFHPQEDFESYTSIPAIYTLNDFQLIGENSRGEYCHIMIQKKNSPPENPPVKP